MNKIYFIIASIVISQIILFSCSPKEKPITGVLFRLGYKTQSDFGKSTGNSGFIFKSDDSTPLLFLTAHHVVAGYDVDKYYSWSDLVDRTREAWIWSQDSAQYEIKLGENLPISGAKALQLDLSAFYLPHMEELSFLAPAEVPAQVGDTVRLFTRLSTGLYHEGVVLYVTDSIFVYEFPGLIRISGSSGSPVLNKENNVVSNNFGGFALPNEQVKEEMVKLFPLINKINVRIGHAYGVGVPVRLIQESIKVGVVQN